MPLDIHASILQQDHANCICELEKQLGMKDFEVKLKGQIIACLLSPSITDYVTITQFSDL
ncbi:hypothetical protein SERLADRAFT_432645 [Serpula lacrymans var. lacrymans S7.9]|uniref:Uncharacterized protein n=1 Tax=Serpula lacrymans var. lacrymans (strain S7.9) TaxID=578457 RepID=F8NG14_SERL9|nr:uncharacterized protein SERLADRAFT_432645 [Serpula lacrymans var. lacrymans S7.9]EGO30984.1 hypothetical protein SERLADRAFT_432645 [Serpula lacrymans var. lacrymans S7.9]